MAVDFNVVEEVAALAHVGLRPDEVSRLAEELASVLEHVARLQSVDTEGVEPTGHVVPLRDVMRDDEVTPCWSPQQALANAPHRFDDFFEVQAILD